MKNRNFVIVFAIATVALAGCEKMNDKHDKFLERGETVYIGKVDSVLLCPGRDRLSVKYWISDPRAKTLTISWGVNFVHKKVVNIPQHATTDALEVYFSPEDSLTEGNYTMHWVSGDEHGNTSIVYELLAATYGEMYQSKLLNQRITSTEPDDYNNVKITFAAASSSDEIGINLHYTDLAGHPHDTCYSTPTVINLAQVDFTKGIRYQTLYLPSPSAIDTFYATEGRIAITKSVNVTKGKPATANDNLDGYPASRTVDGTYSGSSSRWVGLNNNVIERWLEVDLQGTYSISNFKIWRDMGQADKMQNFSLQAFDAVANTWKDMVVVNNAPNEVGPLSYDFAPFETSKIRLYVPAYSGNRPRVYEIEVWSIVEY